MNVDSILISEFAGVHNGSLTVYKTFNQVTGKGLPAAVTMLFISILIHAHRSEKGSEHEIEVKLMNDERKVIKTIDRATIKLGDKDPPPGMPLRHTHVVGQINLKFPRTGPYAFEVYIDGTYSAAASLYVGSQR